AKAMYDAIADHHVTHLCGAPIVMQILLNAAPAEKRPLPHVVRFFTAAAPPRPREKTPPLPLVVPFSPAAAPPPAAVLAEMREAGFEVTHLYGLTETYGPAVINDWQEAWDALDGPEQAALK